MIEILDSTSNSLQIVLALFIALIFFISATSGLARAIFLGLIVMIPFQPITSLYGTLNMVVTYLLGAAMLFSALVSKSGKGQGVPLIIPFFLLFIAYLVSWATAPTYKFFSLRYFFYLIQSGSCVALFYMSYAFFKQERDLDQFFKALIFSNVLVVMYSLLTLFVDADQMSLFGVDELSIHENRKDQRLVGPFLAAGITAEYLVIQSLVMGHYILRTGNFRIFGIVLLLGNFAILVGTGNRGGFLCALLAAPIFLFVNRRYIGTGSTLVVAFSLVFLMASASFLMIKYTDYNVLYSRLVSTEVEGLTPDTRSGWSFVIEQIADRPLTGHGPNIVRSTEYTVPPRPWPKADEYLRYYPHSLYLWILYTTGFIGFLAFANWAVFYWGLLARERRNNRFSQGIGLELPTLGMIILVIFLIDQFKVEFLRSHLLDYQHYIAALFGMFASISKIEVADSAHGKNESHKLSMRKNGLLRAGTA